MSVKALCEGGEIGRAGYYRWLKGTEESARDVELRDRIQRIALEWPQYGYRRITEELQKGQGLEVNHKRVLRLMREDNLLCLRRRKFVLTTDCGHDLPIYPNLARDLVVAGINQLWVADITYVRLRWEFVYQIGRASCRERV